MKIIAYLDIGKVQDFNYDFSIFPKIRENYINSISHEGRKKQSYFVFKLLIKILDKYFTDYNINSLKVLDGKWFFEKGPFFSFSHSNNIVAVAVSDDGPCVVDVEACSDKLLPFKKLNKDVNSSKDELAIFWTERECRVKENSINNHINIALFDVFNNKYILSYGFVSNDNIKFYNACI
ncbi:MAG: hypothetical protein II988_06770 [Clostridia bacterium]|nr:hypothetical protein [Clostridia bacterium]